MANSNLTHVIFTVPTNIVNIIKRNIGWYGGTENLERAEGIVNNPNLTYEQTKRIKNWFDYCDKQSAAYNLIGGLPMETWLNNTLNSHRQSIENGKKIKSITSPKNEYIKPHEKSNASSYKKNPNIPRVAIKASQIMNNKVTYEGLIREEIKDRLGLVRIMQNMKVIDIINIKYIFGYDEQKSLELIKLFLENTKDYKGQIYLDNEDISSIGDIRRVGSLSLTNTNITNLGNLEYVSGFLDIRFTPLAKYTNREEIDRKITVLGRISV